MPKNAELETAIAIKEYIEEFLIPELEGLLAELKKTVAWVKEQIVKGKKHNVS